jgi:hypothetical protein
LKLIVRWSLDRPRSVVAVMVGVTLLLGLLAALPSLWPEVFPALQPLRVDTDPENMLPADEPVRVFHNRMKREFSLHDLIVVGVADEEAAGGVLDVETLGRVYELAEYAETLRWESAETGEMEGVVAVDVLAPSTVDNIEQAGLGAVRFDWLMPAPPATAADALAVGERIRRIPLFAGTLLSEDGRALALYLPLTSKAVSHRVAQALRQKIAALGGDERFFITGLPVAEDTFGVEMFTQMAISAPAAMAVIFLLMLFFFRRLTLVLGPMVLAMVTVVQTMGLLVATGQTIHIMSSMIPIFIMPIAVLDAVHILSELHDRYQRSGDRRRALEEVMASLWTPMLYTSLTTAAGFASLALAPVPPVRVFGLFVAFGVMAAWLWTVSFIPAYVMLLSPERLAGFGRSGEPGRGASGLERALSGIGAFAHRRPQAVVAAAAVVAVLATVGISRIRINDNPVNWFEPSHPVRLGSEVLNRHLGGTYMAFLALAPEAPADPSANGEGEPPEPFKDPELLRYVSNLQAHLGTLEVVGKTTSLADVVKTVHRELLLGEAAEFRIPDTRPAVAQTLLTFESSHRARDLWHFVTPAFDRASIWFQLRSGDNRDMSEVVRAAERYLAEQPPPRPLAAEWFGLTYLNVVWQQRMVRGMLVAFLGGFAVVLAMTTTLFRSLLWGLLSMVPLTVSIGLIYGVIGFAGKDYDMPVAVLSALSLGLAVDYAIHFLARSRRLRAVHGSWATAWPAVFREPARAIARNAVVVGVGFLPLVLAPLVPYQTVGLLIAAILLTAGAASLVLLPALVHVLERRLFPAAPATAVQAPPTEGGLP